MSTELRKRIFGLDLLRAIAISLVVFSHCSWFFPSLNGPAFTLFNFAGLFGVEIFFVLSGFLIGRILYRIFVLEDFSFKILMKFWKRRWLRTLPNYYLILIINVLLAIIIYDDLPNDIWKFFLFLQNFGSAQSPFFYESWSLSIEEFAYIIGPVLFLFSSIVFRKVNRKRLFLLILIMVVFLFLGSKLQYHLLQTDDSMLTWTTNLKSVVIYRIDAIYYGMIVSYFYMNNIELWNKYKLWTLIFGVLLFLVFNGYVSFFAKQNMLIWNVLYLPLNSIVIVLILPFFSMYQFNKGLFYKVFTFLSITSYSIYLVHYSVVLKLFKHFGLQTQSPMETSFLILAYLTITVLISYLLNRYFEKPIMSLQSYNKVT